MTATTAAIIMPGCRLETPASSLSTRPLPKQIDAAGGVILVLVAVALALRRRPVCLALAILAKGEAALARNALLLLAASVSGGGSERVRPPQRDTVLEVALRRGVTRLVAREAAFFHGPLAAELRLLRLGFLLGLVRAALVGLHGPDHPRDCTPRPQCPPGAPLQLYALRFKPSLVLSSPDETGRTLRRRARRWALEHFGFRARATLPACGLGREKSVAGPRKAALGGRALRRRADAVHEDRLLAVRAIGRREGRSVRAAILAERLRLIFAAQVLGTHGLGVCAHGATRRQWALVLGNGRVLARERR